MARMLPPGIIQNAVWLTKRLDCATLAEQLGLVVCSASTKLLGRYVQTLVLAHEFGRTRRATRGGSGDYAYHLKLPLGSASIYV
jgi:hypothetical protein